MEAFISLKFFFPLCFFFFFFSPSFFHLSHALGPHLGKWNLACSYLWVIRFQQLWGIIYHSSPHLTSVL